MSELLPKDGTPWPLPEVAERYKRMALADAWYSGDPDRLRSAHGQRPINSTTRTTATLNAGGGVANVKGTTGDSFWSTSTTMERDTRRHLPVPQDIATMSADLLFSEPPTFRVMGPVGAKGTDQEDEPTPETRAAQQRLDAVLRKGNFISTLLAAAETSSPLGSVGLRIAFDKTAMAGGVNGRPVITRVDADATVPYYSWGQLLAVAFWQTVEADTDQDVVWRYVELHQGGKSWPALYKGSAGNIGKRVGLAEHAFSRGLVQNPDGTPRALDVDGSITIDPAGGRTATSIPNMLPDPAMRANQVGRSDYTHPVMQLFEDIDKAYTQFMDELDDAKSRLFIADSMLDRGAPGQADQFDPDRRLYRRVTIPPSEEENGKLPIEKVQFDLRVEQYLATIEALTYKAIDAAGYSPKTQREQEGGAMTATETNSRDRKGMSTRDKKIRYWEGELAELLTTFLRVDVEQFAPWEQVDGTSVRVQPFPVEVQFPEAVQPTQIELATTAKMLKEAGESVLEIQRVLHPDWSERKLREAAQEIGRAASVIDPVSFGTAGQGVGPGDGI